jgi:hypothetical protein
MYTPGALDLNVLKVNRTPRGKLHRNYEMQTIKELPHKVYVLLVYLSPMKPFDRLSVNAGISQ